MMVQYRRIKSELPPDALLLFRLGDFYELFFEDAQTGCQILNVALTKRGVVPMCGIPYHAAGAYIARILRAGRKVAICDQVEEARPGKLVKREVTQVLSPGTHFDERLLNATQSNYLVAIYESGGHYGLAVVELTTAEFKATEIEDDAALAMELDRLRPAEVVYPSEAGSLRSFLASRFKFIAGCEDWVFAPETAQFTMREHFKVASLDGLGLRGRSLAVGAAGGVLHYLAQSLRRDVSHLTRFQFYQASDYLILDTVTVRNLEVIEPLHKEAARDASLFGALNRTSTPMGARRLRDWLSRPLAQVEAIRQRQEAVESFMGNASVLEQFRTGLGEVRDLERTLGRLSTGSGNGRDLVALRLALEQLPPLRAVLKEVSPCLSASPTFPLLDASIRNTALPSNDAWLDTPARPPLILELEGQIAEAPDLVSLIRRGLVDGPPLTVKEGGLIREGFDSQLDELRRAGSEGKDWIARLQQQEIESTGISSLKVRFNSVFGYYIEVTKSNLDKVPPAYIRKQTIANGERFITPELKAMEGKILGAEERSIKLEYELFQRIRETVLVEVPRIQQTAAALAQLDVLAAFAETARLYNFCRPQVCAETILEIHEGRHPVLDQSLLDEKFVPNDTHLDSANRQVAIITGPNMAGKSTFIRQVALITLMAHTGCFVPATKARIDLVDRIFTRIGASDDLSRGQSTFMVEMSETANILNNATSKSLVILDEVGRGTSTFDGLSLAWSIVEHLHNQVGAKTLFATHYHELTELAGRLPRVRNFNVAVREWNDQIIFLRKIVEGGADKSYGIQVARLAGVPHSVLDRARDILRNLEEAELTPEGQPRAIGRHRAEREKLKRLAPTSQLDLFSMGETQTPLRKPAHEPEPS